MTMLTIEIDKDKDLAVLKELIDRLGLKYSLDTNSVLSHSDTLRQITDKRYNEYLDGAIKLISAEESQLEIHTLLSGKNQ